MTNVRLGPPVGYSRFSQEWQDFLEWEWKSNIGEPEFGLSYAHTSYNGPSYVHDIQNLDDTDSNGLRWRNYDGTMFATYDNNGANVEAPWSYTGDGNITGNIVQTGDYNLTGDFDQTGNMTIDGLIHGLGAVDFDSTLNVDGAVTFQTTLHGIGAVDFDSTLNVDGNVTLNANVTLGNAAGDVITGTGTATFAEDFTLSKRLIVAGDIVNDTTTFVTSAADNRVSVGAATVSTGPIFDVTGTIRSANVTTPTTGTGVELAYVPGASLGAVVCIDRATTTYKALRILGLSIDLRPSDTSKLTVDSTGIGVFAHATAGQAADWGTVATGTADATYGNSERDSINEHSVAINAIRTALRSWGWVA